MDIPKIRGFHMRQGKVLGTYITPANQSISIEKDAITLLVNEGVVGDCHSGQRLSDTREDILKTIGVGKEVPIANLRQVSIVSQDSMKSIAKNMGFPVFGGGSQEVSPTLLGANLLIENITVDSLPAGTLLCFASEKNEDLVWHKVVIGIWAPNDPCKIPHNNIVADMRSRSTTPGGWSPEQTFVQAAKGMRGVVGFVYCSGKIKKGDVCVAYIPE